jgi:hypothetical protein
MLFTIAFSLPNNVDTKTREYVDAFGKFHMEFEGERSIADRTDVLTSLDIPGGKYIYAVGEDYFVVFDVEDPIHPRCVCQFQPPTKNRKITYNDVEIRGNLAYIVGKYENESNNVGILKVLNIADRENPYQVSEYIDKNGDHDFTAIEIEGKTAYLTDRYGFIYSIDITDPANLHEPILRKFHKDLVGAIDFVVSGRVMYVSCENKHFARLNLESSSSISDPKVLLRSEWIQDIYLDGDLFAAAKISNEKFGIGRWEKSSNNYNSVIQEAAGIDYKPRGIACTGNFGYIVGYNYSENGLFSTISAFDGMFADTVTYLCSHNWANEALTRVRKVSESFIYAVGRYDDGEKSYGMIRAIRLAVLRENLFTTMIHSSLLYAHRGINRTEPSQIEIRGDIAYVVDSCGMLIFDVSTPAVTRYFVYPHPPPIPPDFADYLDTDHIYFGIDVVTGDPLDYIYLTSDDKSVPPTGRSFWAITHDTDHILSVSGGPTAPGGHTNIIGEVEVLEDYAYTFSIDEDPGLFQGRGFLDAFDISTPGAPFFVSSDKLQYAPGNEYSFYVGDFGEVEVNGDTAWVSWRSLPYTGRMGLGFAVQNTNHIGFFDISDPGPPPAGVEAFVPLQTETNAGGVPTGFSNRSMGYYRLNFDCPYGGAIDFVVTELYSTIGYTDNLYPPISGGSNYGLFKYDVETRHCGLIYNNTAPNNLQSHWENYYELTELEWPLEVYYNDPYVFCSWQDTIEDPPGTIIKVGSPIFVINVNTGDTRSLPITNCIFNDYKMIGNYLIAVGETLSVVVTPARIWNILVSERLHPVVPEENDFGFTKTRMASHNKEFEENSTDNSSDDIYWKSDNSIANSNINWKPREEIIKINNSIWKNSNLRFELYKQLFLQENGKNGENTDDSLSMGGIK